MQQAAAENKRLSINASNAAYRLANPERVRAWPIDNWVKNGSVTQEAKSLFNEICDLIRKETNAPEV